MKTTIQTLFVAILSGLLSLAVTACVPGGEVSGDVNGETGDAFVDAIPTAQMLSLSTDEDTVSQGLTIEQGLTGEPSEIRAHAERVREGLNRLREETHARIDRIVAEGEMTELTLERATCKRWDLDGEQNHWQLTSCKGEGRQDGGAGDIRQRMSGRDDLLLVHKPRLCFATDLGLSGHAAALKRPRSGRGQDRTGDAADSRGSRSMISQDRALPCPPSGQQPYHQTCLARCPVHAPAPRRRN